MSQVARGYCAISTRRCPISFARERARFHHQLPDARSKLSPMRLPWVACSNDRQGSRACGLHRVHGATCRSYSSRRGDGAALAVSDPRGEGIACIDSHRAILKRVVVRLGYITPP